ncbi:MAG: carbohydrate ABC transporter permease [Treponema sp.]|nr:carbohydrate ABC transporter permease [Treponema sp.]
MKSIGTSSYRVTLSLQRCLIYVFMVFLTLLALIPIYIMLVNATRSTEEINAGISILPSGYLAHNWSALTRGWGIGQIARGFYNSAIIALSTTVLNVYFSAMTAYGLHVYRFRGRNILWAAILIIIMLPASLSFMGFFQLMANMNLLDNFIPLIIPAIAGAGSVLFIRQYMATITSETLIEAARIDGANEFYVFNKIMLPILTPALAAQSIFTFVGSWNNFFAPFILISSRELYTLPMLVQMLRGDIFRTEFGGIYLGIAISIVPIIIFYAFMSRFIISGLTLGGVKE